MVDNLLTLPKLQFFSSVSWERNTCFSGLLKETGEVVYNQTKLFKASNKALCSGKGKHSTVAIKETKLLKMWVIMSLVFFRFRGMAFFSFMTLVSSNNFYYISIFC